ncbi:MAG: hypothetical protein M4579_005540 [Chaenotheca gracillima]|nr:MAG: hypothetical protein M4579_005540 [Chaenotheca gracillima]
MSTSTARSEPYAAKHAVIVFWARDDSDARREALSMSLSLNHMGIISQTKLTLAGDTPAWDVADAIRSLEMKFRLTSEPKLIIFFYAGHATVDDNGRLRLCESTTSTRGFNFDAVADELTRPVGDYHGFAQTDVVLFLDCCYPARVMRRPPTTGRTVEVFAAAAATKWATLEDREELQKDSREPANCLTNMFTMAVQDSYNRGREAIDSGWLLRVFSRYSGTSSPYHDRLLGTTPIRVPTGYTYAGRTTRPAPIAPSPPTPSSRAQTLFSDGGRFCDCCLAELDQAHRQLETLPETTSLRLRR